MPTFSTKSKKQLDTCHPYLQLVLNKAIEIIDFTVLEGHRNQETQDRYFKEGKSQLKYPNGKHNKVPSMAVDIVPYPIDWDDKERFKHLAGIIKGIAHSYGIDITWGGDWKKFVDMPHFELN